VTAPKIVPRKPPIPHAPRTSREVTPDTIGNAGIAEQSDEVELPPPGDPKALAATIKLRAERLRRHNLLVREFAALFKDAGAKLYENPFDILALFGDIGILVEVKTLDGTVADERERVRDSLGQLLYYEGFLTSPVAGETVIGKIACFESNITPEHAKWLNGHGMGVVWKKEGKLVGDDLACKLLAGNLKEFGDERGHS
jgi:hypothetical protein